MRATAVALLTALTLIAPPAPQQTTAPRPTCTMPGGRSYYLGTTVVHGQRFYRCLSGFGRDMAPVGAVWVEVEKSAARWVTPRLAE